MITAVAVLAVRDEGIHVPHVVHHLLEEGIDVVVLDDGSTDAGADVLDELAGGGLIETQRRPRRDSMAIVDLLEWKSRVIAELPHDWVLHHDADEWLMAPGGPGGLLSLLDDADAAGATVVNFEEFVFTPIRELGSGADPRRHMVDYYFYEPAKVRLMRSWRRDAGLSNRSTGGHRLTGDALALYPEVGILRHYPIVTPEHGIQKYGQRRFDPEELARALHRNRMPLVEATTIRHPTGPLLRHLDSWRSAAFDRSAPSRFHFWEAAFEDQDAPIGATP